MFKVNVQSKCTKEMYKGNVKRKCTKEMYKGNIQRKYIKVMYKVNVQCGNVQRGFKSEHIHKYGILLLPSNLSRKIILGCRGVFKYSPLLLPILVQSAIFCYINTYLVRGWNGFDYTDIFVLVQNMQLLN